MNSILATALVTFSMLVQPAPSEPGPSGSGAGGGSPAERPRGERRASVEGAMKIMDRNLEQLRGQAADASKREENLGLVNEMQRGCVIGKGLPVPQGILDKAGSAAAQDKLRQTFRADMLTLLKRLIALEEAILAGKADDINAALNLVIEEQERGHRAMGMVEDDPFRPK